MKYSILFASFLLMSLFSCSFTTKQGYITKWDSFIEETAKKYPSYSDKEWERADTLFARLDREEDKFQSDFTLEDLKHINELKGKYLAFKTKAGLNSLKNGLMNAIDQAQSFIKELGSDSVK